MAIIRYRKYVAAIIFTRQKNERLFLLLHRKQNWKGWEYVKGGLLPNESEFEGLTREIFEETGIGNFKIHSKLKKKIKYKWPKEFQKDTRFWHGAEQSVYIVEVFTKKIRLDRKEHSGHKWVSGKSAVKLLTYKEPKAIMKFALKKNL